MWKSWKSIRTAYIVNAQGVRLAPGRFHMRALCKILFSGLLQLIQNVALDFLRVISLRLMTQFKDIVNHTHKYKSAKCIFCGIWVQNFTLNFEHILHKKNICVYEVLKVWRVTVLSKVENPGQPNGPTMVDRWVVHVTFGWSVYMVW